MKSIIMTVLIGSVLSGAGAWGQGFGFNVAVSHYQVKEYNLNSLVHSGPGLNIAGVYEHYSDGSRQRLELLAGMNFLKSKFETEAGSYLIQSSLNYRIGRRVVSCFNGMELYLGGSAGLNAVQGIYDNWDVNHFYWLTSYSVGLHAMSHIRIGRRGSVSLEATLPMIAVISRTPADLFHHEDNPDFLYVIDRIHRDPSLESLPSHFAPEVKLSCHTVLRGQARQTLFWKLSHVKNHVDASDPLLTIQHAFGIEFLF